MAQSKGPFHISACPTCGSAKIRAVQEDWSDSHAGKRYVVRNLRYFRLRAVRREALRPERHTPNSVGIASLRQATAGAEDCIASAGMPNSTSQRASRFPVGFAAGPPDLPRTKW